ncbi:MAG: hypothetical protein PHN90_08210 [Methanothrix sp.]|nr:hypothetical protein [Methanothrix sp.]OPX80903.1 MAG: hypothetical protein A4E50_01335 [Methanosaeta sp. PtaB.Bin087]HOI70638.1 hypothetical protein [Methanothrix sp.]
MVDTRTLRILQSAVTIGLGFFLGSYFGHLLELSPIGTGLLAGGFCFLANVITAPIFGLGRGRR